MPMESTRKLMLSTVLGSSIIVIVLLGIGVIAGRYTIIRTFTKQVQGYSEGFTLGNLLRKIEKKSIDFSAYYEGNNIIKKLDDISWAVPNIPSPFVGNAPMPGLHGVAHINAMQFRADKEVEIPKPPHTYRIFITGGSTAYGCGAPSDDRTIAGYLDKILSDRLSPVTRLNYEVFTMANPGWASTHERIIIENVLSELEPDMIISFSGVNDVHWGNLGRNILWFRSYPDEFFLGLIKTVYQDTRQPAIPEITHIDKSPVPPPIVAKRLLKNVTLSSFVLSGSNVDYVFVLQPALAVTNKPMTKHEPASDYFRQCYGLFDTMLKTLHSKHFQYVNLSGAFGSSFRGQNLFIDSYHFGDRGNEMIAENIYSQIKERIAK